MWNRKSKRKIYIKIIHSVNPILLQKWGSSRFQEDSLNKTYMEINEVEDSFIINPADKDVFNTSSGRLKKVTTSYDQTSCHDVWKRRWIYDVLKMSDLRRSKDVLFTMSWRRPICDVLKTSDLIHLEDFWFVTSWKCLRNCSNVVATFIQHRKKCFLFLFCTVWTIHSLG